ncbi:MAG TPA: hypothetical protein VG097_04155, partial [Gemmata sp.]|nr:hypothetical protein [Gemmata sp.]
APEDQSVPKYVLTQEEEEIGEEVGAEKPLAFLGGEDKLQRTEYRDQEHHTETGREKEIGDVHGSGTIWVLVRQGSLWWRGRRCVGLSDIVLANISQSFFDRFQIIDSTYL